MAGEKMQVELDEEYRLKLVAEQENVITAVNIHNLQFTLQEWQTRLQTIEKEKDLLLSDAEFCKEKLLHSMNHNWNIVSNSNGIALAQLHLREVIMDYVCKCNELVDEKCSLKQKIENNMKDKYEELTREKVSTEREAMIFKEKIEELNCNLEQLKTEYEMKLLLQNNSFMSLKKRLEEFQESEARLRLQLNNAQNEFDQNMDAANELHKKEIMSLTFALENNQIQLNEMVRELEETKVTLGIVNDLEKEMEEMKLCLQQKETVVCELEERAEELEKANLIYCNNFKLLTCELEEEKVQTGTRISELNRIIKELQTNLHDERELRVQLDQALQLSQKALDERTEELRIVKDLRELDYLQAQQRYASFETAVAENDSNSQHFVEELRSRELTIKEQNETLANIQTDLCSLVASEKLWQKLKVLYENEIRTLKYELDLKVQMLLSMERDVHKAQSSNNQLQVKMSNCNKMLEQKEALFVRLRNEAEKKLTEAKAESENWRNNFEKAQDELANKDEHWQRELSSQLEAFKNATLQTDQSAMDLKYQIEINVLSEKLEKEQENMIIFKENAIRQLKEQQSSAKEMIKSIKESCEQSLKDRDEICQKKLKKLEKQFQEGN